MVEFCLITRFLGGLAFLAFLMSMFGVYMVISYFMVRRTKEVVLRRAIGADSLDVLQLFVIPTLIWILVGLTIGIVSAIAVVGVLRSMVLRTTELDVLTVAGIGTVYFLIVAIAVAVPAWWVLWIHPAGVLWVE